jgi:hypothetical protein
MSEICKDVQHLLKVDELTLIIESNAAAPLTRASPEHMQTDYTSQCCWSTVKGEQNQP